MIAFSLPRESARNYNVQSWIGSESADSQYGFTMKSFMPRVLLFSNTTGYQANAFKEAAERMGTSLGLRTHRRHVLEDPWQDGAIPMRFEDPQDSAEKIADFANRHPVDGIVAIG